MRTLYEEGDLISVSALPRERGYLSQRACMRMACARGGEQGAALIDASQWTVPFVSQAEVQTLLSDGSVSLHTRSFKYGKVRVAQSR